MKPMHRSSRLRRGKGWWPFFCVSLGLAGNISQAFAQETVRESLAGEKAAQATKQGEIPTGYNMHVGPVGFSIEPSLRLNYNDNIYWAPRDRLDDFIFRPEVRLSALWPITELNTLSLALGVGYEYYIQHTDLNTSSPLISPDTDLALNLFTGDFHFRFHDSFSYQESLTYYQGANQFINFNNVAKFGRYDNRAGVSADWDLNKLILNFGYDHENFWVRGTVYDYENHTTDLFWANLTYAVNDAVKVGVETRASFTDYEKDLLGDQWRFGVGPFLDWTMSKNLQLRIGGGMDITQASANFNMGSEDFNNYYAYVHINHRLNEFFTHSFAVGHENQLGWNAANMADTYFRYNAVWRLIRKVDLGMHAGVYFFDETGYGFSESYTYFNAGLDLTYQLTQRWRSNLSYNFTQKDSDLPNRDYCQNVVSLALSYRF
jgi:hypothetical protein